MLNIEHGTFTHLIFTTTGGMGKECLNYHSRLAELMPKPSHRYEQEPLLEETSTVRKSWHFRNTDIEIGNTEGAIY